MTVQRVGRLAGQLPFPDDLSDVAYYGVLGRLVRKIEPHTEADPAAILTQLIAAVGCIMGRRAGWKVESTFHACALWVLTIGESSTARKGTATGRVEQVVDLVRSTFLAEHRVSGLSSGEGLIAHLAPPEPDADEEEDMDAPPPPDGRLLVESPEFASVLRNTIRQGNILSMTLRTLWDHGRAQTLTKHRPLRCQDAHVSLLAHITRDELQRELTDTDVANGFANRFLFVAARHRRDLPFGGNLTDDALRPDAQRLEAALTALELRYGTRTLIEFTDLAADLWRKAYPLLRADRQGLAGAACTRAEAQVRRIAVVHALANDGEATNVTAPQLAAALDLWRYAEQSAYWTLGNALGDRAADRLVNTIRGADGEWLTRGQLHEAFAGHLSADRLDNLLAQFVDTGWIQASTVPTAGRPREQVRWIAPRERSEKSEGRGVAGWSKHLFQLYSLYSQPRYSQDEEA